MNKLLLTTVLSLLASHAAVFGQGDTLADMRRFMNVCNSYKNLPMELSVEISRRTMMATKRGDSSRLDALFCLRPEGAYIAMEGVEQLVNDSLMLLVNKITKRMTVFSNRQSVADRMRAYLGVQLGDSSLAFMCARYRAALSAAGGDTAVIEISSRAFLPQSTLPREELRLCYNGKTNEPIEIVESKRTLVMVPGDVYKSVAQLPEWSSRAISVKDSVFFLVKEQTISFRYRNISHNPGGRLPAVVSDRIVAESSGRYRPVSGFAGYVVDRQF